jgi:hypothetical protein
VAFNLVTRTKRKRKRKEYKKIMNVYKDDQSLFIIDSSPALDCPLDLMNPEKMKESFLPVYLPDSST